MKGEDYHDLYHRRFQYRKRYGLHAMMSFLTLIAKSGCFNTASGMDCMQFKVVYLRGFEGHRFNTASGMDCMQYRRGNGRINGVPFQYRKRYGLHAIQTV